MKKLKQAVILTAAWVLTGGLMLTSYGAQAAGTVNVHYYLTPASASVTNGQNLAVQVWEDSGSDNINTIQANLNYPSSGLSMTSVAYDGSAFDSGASGNEGAGGAGTVKISRIFLRKTVNGTVEYGVSGAQYIATIYFNVTATSGTQTVSFDPSSAAWTPPSDLNDPNTVQSATITSTPGSYSLGGTATPPPPPPPPPPSSGGSGTGGSSSSSTQKTGTTVKPAGNTSFSSTSGQLTISNISVTNLTNSSATVNWTTTAAATSEVDYGTASDQLYLTDSDSNYSTSHSVTLKSSNLQPNKVFYFVVKSTDKSGNVAKSDELNFQTGASSAISKLTKQSKTAAIAAVSGIAVIAIIGAIIIRQMHKRALQNQELASHIATPGTAVINGKVTVTPDPKQTPPNPNGPKTG